MVQRHAIEECMEELCCCCWRRRERITKVDWLLLNIKTHIRESKMLICIAHQSFVHSGSPLKPNQQNPIFQQSQIRTIIAYPTIRSILRSIIGSDYMNQSRLIQSYRIDYIQNIGKIRIEKFYIARISSIEPCFISWCSLVDASN